MTSEKKKINNRATLSAADLEQNTRHEPLAKKEIEGFTTLVNVHVHSIRNRLADSDGISAKAVIDGIVKRGLLVDDSSKEIKSVSYSQEKGKEEKTIITIEEV